MRGIALFAGLLRQLEKISFVKAVKYSKIVQCFAYMTVKIARGNNLIFINGVDMNYRRI